MRILTISVNAWNNTIATGNTFSNFFNGISDCDEIANIYCRNEIIENQICTRYFRISERDILNSLCCFEAPGISFDKNDVPYLTSKELSVLAASSSKGNFLRKRRPAFLLFMREIVWSLKSWQSKKLKSFLDDFNPDIIYMHVHGNWYMHSILWFCANYTGAKVALFTGDDVYSYHRSELLQRLYQWILRKKVFKSFTKADIVFGGSSQLCKEYGEIFRREIIPLYKVCNNLKEPYISQRSYPLQVVYCGNLLYGREKILAEIVDQIKILNKDGLKLQMHLYTGNSLSNVYTSILNDGINCIYEGKRPFSEITEILNNSDFSLFVESFDPDAIKLTRLSFSTKIIDYMESSSALISIGPANIASIDYIRNSGISIFVSEPNLFAEVLYPLISNHDLISEFIRKKYDYALKNHSNPILLQYLYNLLRSE